MFIDEVALDTTRSIPLAEPAIFAPGWYAVDIVSGWARLTPSGD
jgi:hypothetical protein